MNAGKKPWETDEPPIKDLGLPLEYVRALRSDVLRDWRITKNPTMGQIKEWAKQVADLNACIAAMEAEIVEQTKPIKR